MVEAARRVGRPRGPARQQNVLLDRELRHQAAVLGHVTDAEGGAAISRQRDQTLAGEADMAGVNPALTQSLLDHILDLKGFGMTVLFVEHDMEIVGRYAERVLAFYEGRVIADGTPAVVLGNAEVQRYVTGVAP